MNCKVKFKQTQTLFQSAMSVNNGATLFFCVFMSIWVAYFLESWKRKQALLGHIWGVLKFDQSDVSKIFSIFRSGERKEKFTTNKTYMYCWCSGIFPASSMQEAGVRFCTALWSILYWGF